MSISQYLVPQVTVQQQYAAPTVGAITSMDSCIVGPQYKRFVYSEGGENENVSYGAYDYTQDTVKSLLAFPALSSLDSDSVNVVFEKIWALYASVAASGSTKRGAASNRIIWAGAGNGFKTSGAYARSSVFGYRDVSVGDRLLVKNSAGTISKETYVTGFVNDVVAESIPGGYTNASTNKAAQSLSVVDATIEDGGTDHTAIGAGTYIGDLNGGILNDVYTLECIVGGAPLTAKFKVTSASNTDNVASVTTVAFDSAMNVGTRGATITFSSTGTQAFVVGEKYTLTCAAAFAQHSPVSTSSTYAGPVDSIYYIEVVRGGLWAENPQVRVTTSNGIDQAPAVSVAYNTTFNVGTYGLKMKFDDVVAQGGLLAGDIYTLSVVARSVGPVKTLIIADSLDSSIAENDNVAVDFHIYKTSLAIPAAGYPGFSDVNWTVDAENNAVSLKQGIDIEDLTWVNGTGDLLPMPVVKANIFISYRSLIRSGAGVLNTISDISLISAVLGDIVPENPLAYGVYKALQNAGGRPVRYVAVESDTLAGYAAALPAIENEDSPNRYHIAPMSEDYAVQSLFRSFAISQSSEHVGQYCKAYVSVPLSEVVSKYDLKSDGLTGWSGTVAEDPDHAGEFTRLTVTGATFLTDAIRAGDTLQIDFALDANNNEVYSSYTIDNVISQEELELARPGLPSIRGPLAVRIKIVRSLTKAEQAAQVAYNSSTFGTTRVISVWPDLPTSDDGSVVPGHFLAAAIAGLASSVAPHQGLTDVTVKGFKNMDRSSKYFTPSQLDIIAAGGTWIVTQDNSGTIFNRHQLSTDTSDEMHQEASFQTNYDSVCYGFILMLRKFKGRYNINDQFLALVDNAVKHRFETLKADTITATAGPQVIDYTKIKTVRDSLVRTKVRITGEVQLPFAANYIQLTLLAV